MHYNLDQTAVASSNVLCVQASNAATAFSENYFFPEGAASQAALDKRWQDLTATEAQHPAAPLQLTVMFGRQLQVPLHAHADSPPNAGFCQLPETHCFLHVNLTRVCMESIDIGFVG